MRARLLGALGLLVGCPAPRTTATDATPPAEAAEPEPPAARDGPGTILEANIPLLDGGAVTLEELRGRPVVLAVALTAGESFTPLATELAAVVDRHRDGVTVVVVAADPDPDTAVRDWPGPVVLGHDPQGALATRLQVRTLPVVFVLDADGRIVDVRAGDVARITRELPDALQRALAVPAS